MRSDDHDELKDRSNQQGEEGDLDGSDPAPGRFECGVERVGRVVTMRGEDLQNHALQPVVMPVRMIMSGMFVLMITRLVMVNMACVMSVAVAVWRR